MLAIRVVYGFGISLRGTCEVTPCMEATTACHGISLIYHTVFTYKPQCSAFDLYLKFSTCNNIILSDIHREVMRVRILSCTVKGRSG